jgi:hypothetical protein
LINVERRVSLEWIVGTVHAPRCGLQDRFEDGRGEKGLSKELRKSPFAAAIKHALHMETSWVNDTSCSSVIERKEHPSAEILARRPREKACIIQTKTRTNAIMGVSQIELSRTVEQKKTDIAIFWSACLTSDWSEDRPSKNLGPFGSHWKCCERHWRIDRRRRSFARVLMIWRRIHGAAERVVAGRWGS